MSEAKNILVGASLARVCASQDRYMRHLGAELVDADIGCATVRLRVGPEHINFNGTCHGGAIFSLADCAFGLASNTHPIIAAGIAVHMTFEMAVSEGELLQAAAVERSRSRKLAVYQIEVTREDGLRVGAFTGTVYVTGKAHAFEEGTG